jgi:hypothetical protein
MAQKVCRPDRKTIAVGTAPLSSFPVEATA